TAMFSLVDGVLLAPLPYAQGDRIVHLRQEQPAIGDDDMTFSVHEIEDYRAGNHTLSDVVEYHGMTFTLLGEGDPELVATGVVSARFFDVLGMKPILGRTFTEEDDHLGADPVMILSNEYWVNHFGSNPDVIGRGYVMNGKVHTVVGVLPPIPQYPDQNDVYMPTSQCPTRSNPDFIANRRRRMMTVFGVLRPGVDLATAQSDVSRVASGIGKEHADVYQPEVRGYDARVSPLKEDLVARARPTLLILMGTAALVLLIACANVASLALARAVRQGQEVAVRQALGAGRGRLVRQLLTENMMLALLGGALGVGLAVASMGVLVKFAGQFTPRAFETSMDGGVLAFAVAVSLATGLFFGSVPALRRANAAGAMLGRSRAQDGGPGGHRAHAWLVAAQVSLAFVLLTGAGLLGRTFMAVSSVDLGYQPQRVLSARITLPMVKYYMTEPGQDDLFFGELRRRVQELPGVRSVAVAQAVPLNGGGFRTGLETEETAGRGPDEFVQIRPVRASTEYLGTLGIPILEGRGLTEADRTVPETSVVLTHSLARRLWDGQDPLSRRVRVCSYNSGQCGDWLTVVGVAGDVKMEGLEDDATPAIYQADNDQTFGGTNLVIRADGDLAALGRGVTDLVHEMEPDAPVSNVRALDAYVSDAVAPRRLTALLMGLFAVLALVVTLAGVAGVVAFTTSRRTHEIGVRLALGADPASVLARIVRVGMVPAAVGLAVGALVAVGLSGALSRLVWGIQATDVVTFVVAAATLLAGALLACWLPARRATRVDPVAALRSD
ncbi:MAG TPA: ABC transporter permease, partial [Longimicrobiales bacterium]|nr:ABC transporter permease [Longimicrobiales bacterium]